MTRKDYVLIADALKCVRTSAAGRDEGELEDRLAQWSEDCEAVADALANDNPRFDRDRFLKACGVAS